MPLMARLLGEDARKHRFAGPRFPEGKQLLGTGPFQAEKDTQQWQI